eukprot:3511969-Pyramimonas_sp.AAC.1
MIAAFGYFAGFPRVTFHCSFTGPSRRASVLSTPVAYIRAALRGVDSCVLRSAFKRLRRMRAALSRKHQFARGAALRTTVRGAPAR